MHHDFCVIKGDLKKKKKKRICSNGANIQVLQRPRESDVFISSSDLLLLCGLCHWPCVGFFWEYAHMIFKTVQVQPGKTS